MSVRADDDGTLRLEGQGTLEDAEILLRHLCVDPQAGVDWSGCEQAHTAVVQVLMACKARVIGTPADAFLRRFVAGLFEAAE